MLSIYDREKKEYRRQPPINTAVEKDYYTFESANDAKDCRVEEYLSKIETEAKSAIVKLEARGALAAEERLYLAHFIVLLLVRTPKFAREANEIADSTAKHLIQHSVPTVEAAAELLHRQGKNRADGGITPESLFKFIHDKKFTVEMNRDFVIGAMMDQADKATLPVAMMDWMVVHADSGSAFITTDEPIGYIIPDELRHSGEPVIGLCSEKISKFIPLTQSVALLIGQRGGLIGHFGVHSNEVCELNVLVAKESHRYVIGRDEALVKSVVKQSKVDVMNPGTRMTVEHFQHPDEPLKTFLVAKRVPGDESDATSRR